MSAQTSVRILSAGAAKGLVTQLMPQLQAAHGLQVDGEFGAVGLMRDRLLDGAACDVIILSQALIDQLLADGHVRAESIRPLGVVHTGIAYRSGDPKPTVDSAETLKETLLSARAIYFPDPQKATAGIHFAKVLNALDLDEAVAGRLHPFPNGATAMRELASSQKAGGIGCTQVTEILYTPGVTLAAVLPTQFELATVYTAAVTAKASNPDGASKLIDLISGAHTAVQRRDGGFQPLA